MVKTKKRFFDNMVTITDLRKDIDSLSESLKKHDLTWVMKNQEPYFVVIKPEIYLDMQGKIKQKKRYERAKREKMVEDILQIRKKVGYWPAAKVVTEMRDEERERWRKE